MATAGVLRASLLPLLVLASGTANRCELSTDSGTGELHIVGTVNFLAVEDGCWQVLASDGGRYQLSANQAPPSVLHDGARVALVVRLSEGSAGRCKVGTPVDVRQVVGVDEGG
jgi:hypothetical protein